MHAIEDIGLGNHLYMFLHYLVFLAYELLFRFIITLIIFALFAIRLVALVLAHGKHFA
jgi:hypothetical protein